MKIEKIPQVYCLGNIGNQNQKRKNSKKKRKNKNNIRYIGETYKNYDKDGNLVDIYTENNEINFYA